MNNKKGVEIESVIKGSIAERSGLLCNDKIISINGHEVKDEIDLIFYGSEPFIELLIKRKDELMNIHIKNDEQSNLGIILKPFRIKTCRNRCIFCFVTQLPKGLRKTLYIKDEDYRMSFLYGNYITLTNLSENDKKRIVEQRLSPLYISVHSTDKDIRNRLIGNPSAPDIKKEIKFFASHRIRMHVQVVLCPGYNDDKELERTIRDLYKFYPYVASIAIVPVGITAHRRESIKTVDKNDAIKAIEIIQKFQARFKRRHGDNIVYAADELYIKAEKAFPPISDYGDLPQIENGIGMIPLFMHRAKRLKIPALPQNGKRFVTFTGISFYPYLTRFTERLNKNGINIEVIPIENTFFGSTITVTGLLTGRDIISSLSGILKDDDIFLIPDVTLREANDMFLDDVSVQDINDIFGVESMVIEPTPEGLLSAILKVSGTLSELQTFKSRSMVIS
jgi:putative radical SAM enzyme (TIGR03279 family)